MLFSASFNAEFISIVIPSPCGAPCTTDRGRHYCDYEALRGSNKKDFVERNKDIDTICYRWEYFERGFLKTIYIRMMTFVCKGKTITFQAIYI